MAPRTRATSRPQLESEPLRFMKGLWGLVHALDVRSKRMYREIGVTGPQRLVLRIIGSHPGSSAGEIASVLEIHASTLSGILARLEAGGMIARKADPADGRRFIFRLTAAGRRIDVQRRGTVESAVKRVLARTPPGAASRCADVLRLLAVELQRDDGD